MPGTPTTGHVLIVEDDAIIVEVIEDRLSRDYDVKSVRNARQAEAIVRAGFLGVILLDLGLPGNDMPESDDLALFHRLRAIEPRNRIIIMTAHDTLDVVIGATRAGAFDFITKGNDLVQRVGVTVRNAFDSMTQEEQVAELSSSLQRRDRFARLISQSPQMDEVRAAIDKLAHSKVNALITGQSGTGKEVVARTIHDAGPRHTQPFIAINCAGIPDTLLESELFGYERGAFTGANARKIGKFEAAHGGTLFLDEIGEMSLTLQVKLLRVLQDGRYERLGGNTVIQADARIVAATNKDLLRMVREGTFREDLYYRLAVFHVELPSLAERRGDIPLLVDYFVKQAADEEGKAIRGVTQEVLRLFEMHEWPGNVRQLQNVVKRAALECTTDTITVRELPHNFLQDLQQHHGAAIQAAGVRLDEQRPEPVAGAVTQGAAGLLDKLQSGTVADRLDAALRLAFPTADVLPRIEDLEAAGIKLAMQRLNRNLQMCARRLHISRATLYRRLESDQYAEYRSSIRDDARAADEAVDQHP